MYFKMKEEVAKFFPFKVGPFQKGFGRKANRIILVANFFPFRVHICLRRESQKLSPLLKNGGKSTKYIKSLK